MVLFSPGCTQHALRPSGQASCQCRGGTGGANGHQAWAAFGHVHGVVKVGRIGPLHGLREVGIHDRALGRLLQLSLKKP